MHLNHLTLAVTWSCRKTKDCCF